jgi:hypothetical protein
MRASTTCASVLAAAAAALVAIAAGGAAGDTLPPTAVPEFTGWISGSNTIFHWVQASDHGVGHVAHYEVYRDGKLLTTLSSGTTEWLVAVNASRGHGYQVRAVDDSGNAGALTYEKLSPLPKLRGLTYDAAASALKKGGFKPGTTLYHTCSNDKPGIVIDVRTRGVVALGWEVGLMVSQK